VLSQLPRQAGTASNLTNDAHLAAIALEHNACPTWMLGILRALKPFIEKR